MHRIVRQCEQAPLQRRNGGSCIIRENHVGEAKRCTRGHAHFLIRGKASWAFQPRASLCTKSDILNATGLSASMRLGTTRCGLRVLKADEMSANSAWRLLRQSICTDGKKISSTYLAELAATSSRLRMTTSSHVWKCF